MPSSVERAGLVFRTARETAAFTVPESVAWCGLMPTRSSTTPSPEASRTCSMYPEPVSLSETLLPDPSTYLSLRTLREARLIVGAGVTVAGTIEQVAGDVANRGWARADDLDVIVLPRRKSDRRNQGDRESRAVVRLRRQGNHPVAESGRDELVVGRIHRICWIERLAEADRQARDRP